MALKIVFKISPNVNLNASKLNKKKGIQVRKGTDESRNIRRHGKKSFTVFQGVSLPGTSILLILIYFKIHPVYKISMESFLS